MTRSTHGLPELFQSVRVGCDLTGQLTQLAYLGSVVGGGDDIFRRTPQPKKSILQCSELHIGQHDGIVGQTAALHGGPALVGPLSASLTAVSSPPANRSTVR